MSTLPVHHQIVLDLIAAPARPKAIRTAKDIEAQLPWPCGAILRDLKRAGLVARYPAGLYLTAR